MVDSRDLQLSESYFTVIQVLRIAADWIQESMDDLRRMVEDLERLYISASESGFATFLPQDSEPSAQEVAKKTFRENWDRVILSQELIGKALLARIKKKQEEVKDLRDGVRRFLLTILSETTRFQVLNTSTLGQAGFSY